MILDAAHVRQYPGMYIGNVRSEGLHFLLFSLVSEAVHEWRLGHCRNVEIVIRHDDTIHFRDDGRAIDPNLLTGLFVNDPIGLSPHADSHSRSLSSSHGVIGVALNALCEWCLVEMREKESIRRIRFSRGEIVEPWCTLLTRAGLRRAFVVDFKPDAELFDEARFDFDTIAKRLRELAFLNPGLILKVGDDRTKTHARFHFEEGLLDFIKEINHGESTLHSPVTFCSAQNGIEIRGAFQYLASARTAIQTYMNDGYLREGGTHVSGLRRGLTLGWKKLFRAANQSVNDLVGTDYRMGLTAIIQVIHPDPEYCGAVRWSVQNRELDALVSQAVQKSVCSFGAANPSIVSRLHRRFRQSANARRRSIGASVQYLIP